MKIIAIEEHFLTQEVREAWDTVPAAFQDGSQGLNREEIEERLNNLSDGRIELMDESGVEVQVLSLTTPALQTLEGGQRVVELAQRTNDLIAATVAERPDRFEGFATLPTPSPREAATLRSPA